MVVVKIIYTPEEARRRKEEDVEVREAFRKTNKQVRQGRGRSRQWVMLYGSSLLSLDQRTLRIGTRSRRFGAPPCSIHPWSVEGIGNSHSGGFFFIVCMHERRYFWFMSCWASVVALLILMSSLLEIQRETSHPLAVSIIMFPLHPLMNGGTGLAQDEAGHVSGDGGDKKAEGGSILENWHHRHNYRRA